MTITFFRHGHHVSELNKIFENLYKDNNIFVYEHGADHLPLALENGYNKLSETGDSSSLELISQINNLSQDPYYNKIRETIKNSGKRIIFEKSPIKVSKLMDIEKLDKDSFEEFYKGNFEEAMEKQLQYLKESDSMNKKRDEVFYPQLTRIVDENVLFPIGACHSVYHRMKKEGFDVVQKFPYNPYLIAYGNELVGLMNIEKEITSEMLARIFPIDIITKYNIKYSFDQEKILGKSIEKGRKIGNKMNLEDIKNLSKYLGKDFIYVNTPIENAVSWIEFDLGYTV
jgi:hypothetical protein